MSKHASFLLALTLFGAAALAGGCQARQDFPEPAPGWHSGDYGVLFGRLIRVAGAEPEDVPTWAVRFGERQDEYGGQLALTPAGMMAGFSGGEPVEVRGRFEVDPTGGGTGDPMKGIHYAVESIRLWSGYRE